MSLPAYPLELGRDQVGGVLEPLPETLVRHCAVLLKEPPAQLGDGGRWDQGGHYEQSQRNAGRMKPLAKRHSFPLKVVCTQIITGASRPNQEIVTVVSGIFLTCFVKLSPQIPSRSRSQYRGM